MSRAMRGVIWRDAYALLKGRIMPYETVQFPRTNDLIGTDVSVHWTKDSHAQLKMERHVWRMPAKAHDEMSDTPPVSGQTPVGSVKVADSQMAYKIREATCSGHCGEDGVTRVYDERPEEWVVVRLNGAVETCTGDQILDWPVVHYPEDSGLVAEALVWSEMLSRAEINRMIKVLRRARDDVFGADA